MSRVKQNQITESLIQAINDILKNRCSLSGEEVKFLTDAVVRLKGMKKGITNEKRLEVALEVIILLSKFLNKANISQPRN